MFITAIATIVALSISLGQGAALQCKMVSPFESPRIAVVVDNFRIPSCERCAGNRGVEFKTTPGSKLFATSSGKVSFAGKVAGVNYLVIQTQAGRRITYGKIASSQVTVGDDILLGQEVAVTGDFFYFGIRENQQSGASYVDPANYLNFQQVQRFRAILVTGDPSSAKMSRHSLSC